ncbi:MAG: hypothetical protein UDG86_12505 [Lachnospiraceae bacterium]|nr:hypothetical protein [Lachnospiraceae bacterium]
MQDDSLEGREMLLNEMRETIRQNEQDMRGCAHTYGCRRGYGYEAAPREMDNGQAKSGTFSLRLLVSLLILGGFLWMHMKGTPIFGYNSDKVVEALSQDVDLQELTNSVRIDPEESMDN